MWSARRRLRDAYAALDDAPNFDAWHAAAVAYDRLTGADAWRAEDSCPWYDAATVRASRDALRRARATGDALALAEVLTTALYRHQSELTAPPLYQVALGGTKRLVSEWFDEAEACLRWLVTHPVSGMPRSEVRRRFGEAWQVFGHTALLLSGGATLGFYHLGVVQALHGLGLLPHILSGASTGAMVAAGIGVRTDAEITALFADPDQLRLDGLRWAGLGRAWSQRALLAPEQLEAVLRNNIGEWTFAEAVRRTGRALAISVSPTRAAQKPRLLCHRTSPDVDVVSAVLASSALPGLFPPVQLEARVGGGRVPYAPGERWVDGSIHGDLPKLRLARLFAVNHFIVSQTNPHVLPFVRHHGKTGALAVVSGLTSATVRTQGLFAAEVGRRVAGRGPLGQLAQQAYALVAQEYGGDVDIHPQFRWSMARKLVGNPTRAELAAFLRDGERAVWPQVALIQAQTRIGRTLRTCVQALDAPPTDEAPCAPATS